MRSERPGPEAGPDAIVEAAPETAGAAPEAVDAGPLGVEPAPPAAATTPAETPEPGPAGTSGPAGAPPRDPGRRRFLVVMAALVLLPLLVAGYKVYSLGYAPSDVLPRSLWRVSLELEMDGNGADVQVRTFLPVSDLHQEIGEEQGDPGPFQFGTRFAGRNREATWSGRAVPDGARARASFTVMLTPVRFDLAPDLEVPASYPASVVGDLQPEPDMQVDAPEIGRTLRALGADRGPAPDRLRRIYAFAGLAPRPFKGVTDALTALRLGEASCNGRSRLFTALARSAGIPARLVGGVILESGSKRTSHQWVEAWVGGHWVPFCPTNRHFAELPATYLTLYRGDEALFRHTADINFRYLFTASQEMVPSPQARRWAPSINVWALFERLGLSFSVLRTVLLLPVGALVVVIFRNVVGLPTFGTFLPALIAAAVVETGALWGCIAVLIVVLATSLARLLFQGLRLLHSPMLAILLTAVTATILTTSLVADRLDQRLLSHIALFPIAVLAIASERFYLAMTEKGTGTALRELAGTLVVMLACYVVMNSMALQALVIGFPEVLLIVVAADVYLGRWVGLRVFEYLRFRRLLASATRSGP